MEILGPSVGYTDLLDVAISQKIENEMAEEKAGKIKYHPLRPSSAGYCARRLAYSLNEYRGNAYYDKEPKSPETYRLLELGHAVEFASLRTFQLLKVFQQRYKQQILRFFELARGVEGLKRELVEGSCDFVLWSDKYKAIGDVKSKKDRFSSVFKTGWDEELSKFSHMESLTKLSDTCFYADDLDAFIDELGDDFLTDNLHQLNLYANSAFIRDCGVDHAFLYRYNKNDSRHMEIRFRPSVKAAQYVEKKYDLISAAVDTGNIEAVPQEYFIGSLRCSFCPYSAQCWENENVKKAYWDTMPKKSWPTDLSATHPAAKAIAEWEELSAWGKHAKNAETRAMELLVAEKLRRVKLADGKVYEIKALKTPRPHFELRRSKA